jgi:sec-independent protein translocase protein TatA
MGPLEIGLIVLVILVIFGVGKLPQVGGAIGKAIREFRKARQGELEEEEPEPGKASGKKRLGEKAKSGSGADEDSPPKDRA